MTTTGSEELSEILRRAEERLWIDFKDAGAFKSTTDIGDAREKAIAHFLKQRLPSRFEVARGEVIDAAGNRSGQTDILIYDASNVAPLLVKDDGLILLGAEALLATIEVKSRLTRLEVSKSVRGIKKLRSMTPWGSPWGLSRENGEPAVDGLPVFMSTVFGFETDLASTGGLTAELKRLREVCLEEDVPSQWIDRLTVLSRGMVLPSSGSAVSDSNEYRVLGIWFFNLVNFLSREVTRRDPFPWPKYESNSSRSWKRVLPKDKAAPQPKKAGSKRRQRYGRR